MHSLNSRWYTEEMFRGFNSNYVLNDEFRMIFQCYICKKFPRNICQLGPCGHFFCEGCLGLKHKDFKPQTCSFCGAPYLVKDVLAVPSMAPAMRLILQHVKVRCSFDCGRVFTATQIAEHQKYGCDNRLILCPFIGCEKELPAAKMQTHIGDCQKRSYFCERCRLPINSERHDCVFEQSIILQDALTAIQLGLHALPGGKQEVLKRLRLGEPGQSFLPTENEHMQKIREFCRKIDHNAPVAPS